MQKLFTEFNTTTSAQWKEQLIKDLKGIDFNTLVWKTNNNIDVQPFYTQENITSVKTPLFSHNDWAICEIIVVEDEQIANGQALNALQNGASGLVFSISKKINFEVLLKDILLEHIYCLFKTKPEFENELHTYLNSISIGNTCFVECDQLLNGTIKRQSSIISINMSLYQEAGANTINELAFSIAHLNEYLNDANEKNLLSEIKKIHITISVGGDFFMEIAKLRALRNLISCLLNEYHLTAKIHIHAQTTLINKSTIDSYNNMLRSTTEAMSASIGGADSILVLPFDSEFKSQNDFSSRMARNQQLILKDESYLNKVADISAGSYYIETITETICEKAWEQFKEIEKKGGFLVCLKSNYIQDLISKDAENLIKNFKEGKLVLVGINKFQNKQEPTMTVTENSGIISKIPINGIKPIRLADFI